MNRKGSLPDTIYGPIFILIIGITMFLAVYIWIQTSGAFAGMTFPSAAINASVQAEIAQITPIYSLFDYMIPFLVGTLLLLSLIFAFKRGASVTYIALALIFWILALIMTIVYSNVFVQFSAALPSVQGYFPILTWIMNNMNWVVLAWLFMITIVMFTRNKREDNQIQQAEEVFMR